MPYNYLLDKKYRENFNLDLGNTIIIVDEAHNINAFAEDNESFDLTLEQMKNASKELERVQLYSSSGSGMSDLGDLITQWMEFVVKTKDSFTRS